MSAPLSLSPDQLERLAAFLRGISKARREHDVSLTPYGAITLEIDGNTLEVNWDRDAETYRVVDRALERCVALDRKITALNGRIVRAEARERKAAS